MSLIVIKDEQIAYPKVLVRSGLTVDFLPEQSYYTEYGFLIPLSNSAYELLSFFETGKFLNTLAKPGCLGVLITHEGKVYSYTYTTDGIDRSTVMVGEGCRWSRAHYYEPELSAKAAMAYRWDMKEIIADVSKSTALQEEWIAIKGIGAIVAELQKRKLQKSVPNYRCSTKHFDDDTGDLDKEHEANRKIVEILKGRIGN